MYAKIHIINDIGAAIDVIFIDTSNITYFNYNMPSQRGVLHNQENIIDHSYLLYIIFTS